MNIKPNHQQNLLPIGSVLQARRLELDLSQQDLAERSGLHRTYISDVERGIRNISVGTLKQLCAALEIEAWRLLLATEPPGPDLPPSVSDDDAPLRET